jgi:NitT/TauT family transport system permease protein
MIRPQLRAAVLGLAVPLGIVILWQLLSLVEASPLFPGPTKVALAIFKNWPVIVRELGFTLWRAAAGFVLATVTMIPLGIFLGRIHIVGKVVEPIMDMVATLPPPAIIPLVMLFAGTGDWAKIVIIAYAAAVPLLMNTYEASHSIHPMLSRVAKSLQLTRIETMRLIDLPSSLPMIATGARLAIASSLLVSITSEMLLATNGIGVYLQRSQETFKIDAGLAGIAFISLAGIIINALVFKLERKWLFWHYRDLQSSE